MSIEVKEREFKVSRLFNAPIELVWKAWTRPEHIVYGGNQMVSPIELTKWKSEQMEPGSL